MSRFEIRKITLVTEEIRHDGGPVPETPRLRGAILAQVSNPFAGAYHPELQPAMDELKPLGLMMSARLIAALGGADGIDGYGKGAIVGEGGEIEHGALWHVPGGYSMREHLGESRAIVPSAMKVGGMGTTLDVPLGHINAAYVRSHFDAMTVGLPDGPRAAEIVFALAMSKGGRVHSRMGGLEAWDVKGQDGLR
ncbi:amino acid synthesis family protein [Frigidibacter sp. MR17.24]|uniref:amino acid synthesis family protein n=1 Tax=Frigidibacter sp. MR17.24 TaxID=3127345 RepID=UPI003012C977